MLLNRLTGTLLNNIESQIRITKVFRISGRSKISYQKMETAAGVAEFFFIVVITALSGLVCHCSWFDPPATLGTALGTGAVSGLLFVSGAKVYGLYTFPALLTPLQHFGRMVGVWSAVSAAIAAFLLFLKDDLDFAPWPLIMATLPQLIALSFTRFLFAKANRALLSAGRIAGRPVVTIGEPVELAGLSAKALLQSFGLSEVCRVAIPAAPSRRCGEIKAYAGRAADAALECGAAEFLLVLSWNSQEIFEALRAELRRSPHAVSLLPDRNIRTVLGEGDSQGQRRILPARVFPVRVKRPSLTPAERAAKRLMDIAMSLTALAILWPLFVLTAIAIKLDSEGPVIFRQRRAGLNSKEFVIFKFRTMTVLEDGPSITQAFRGDHRVTRVGRFLRRSSIDELPQLFNVLRGDMSLVGPRPHAVAHDMEYAALIADYGSRNLVKPGMTGWAQVKGLRGETRCADLMRERVKLDLWYIDNWSFGLDISILFRTCLEVLRDRAY